jgi:hypothetical protein
MQDGDSSQDPTALRVAVSRFLSSEGRDYLIGVSFLARTRVRRVGAGHFDSSGGTYYFENETSSIWLPEVKGRFGRLN